MRWVWAGCSSGLPLPPATGRHLSTADNNSGCPVQSQRVCMQQAWHSPEPACITTDLVPWFGFFPPVHCCNRQAVQSKLSRSSPDCCLNPKPSTLSPCCRCRLFKRLGRRSPPPGCTPAQLRRWRTRWPCSSESTTGSWRTASAPPAVQRFDLILWVVPCLALCACQCRRKHGWRLDSGFWPPSCASLGSADVGAFVRGCCCLWIWTRCGLTSSGFAEHECSHVCGGRESGGKTEERGDCLVESVLDSEARPVP